MNRDLNPHIIELESKIQILERENELLSAKAEENLLLNRAFEEINVLDDIDTLLFNTLESISVLLNIQFSGIFDYKDNNFKCVSSYALFSDIDTADVQFNITDKTKLDFKLNNACHLKIQDNSFTFNYPNSQFIALQVLILALDSQILKNRYFVFVNDEDGQDMEIRIPLFEKCIRIISAKLERIYYQNELEKLNTELEQKIELRTFELHTQNREYLLLNEDLLRAKEKAEENERVIVLKNTEIEFNNARLQSLLEISQFSTNSIQELLDFALSEAINLTQSEIGYIYFYDESKQHFILNTWSKDVLKECAVMDPQTIYHLESTGCWGEAVRQRKPIIINDYRAENPIKKGIPEGHINLTKFLTIPVFIDDKIVAVAGVANKKTDYNKSDIRQLTLLMDNVWKITEKIQLVNELKEAVLKAQESDRLKTAFLQNMSHEIRTPMNAIMGFSSLMADNFDDKEKLLLYSEIIEQRCTDLLDIINDILDISKIESGQNTLTMEVCNLNEMFAELSLFFSAYQSRTNKQHIELVLHPMHDEWDSIVKTDNGKLKQILINLINNAFKFTDKGSIQCGYKQVKNKLEFYVSDTGIGIPIEKKDYVFERFTQLNNTFNQNLGGTGIGLSIVKALTGLLGGEVWFESECDKGTTFFFTIDYIPGKERQKVVFNTIQTSDVKTNTKIILIVEDEECNSIYLKEILKKHVKNIFTVSTGKDAIKFVQNNSVDIVLMDVRLPDISGYEATKEILKHNPAIKVIAQTAFAASEDRQKAIDSGCIDYISKPIRQEQLLNILSNHLK
jgi:signal transduction histidine kinase/CheY-like chemotaxis protein